ncbi:BspA family leucine-rich repeat surface protein, partial [Candidatus Vampirococcus lugosii]|nr:membrane protein [Candidatus Vampirococcus lugosii]
MKKIGLLFMGTLFLSGISYATVSAGEEGKGYIENGIIYCEGAEVGSTIEIEGETYYVAKDMDDGKSNIDDFGGKYSANRICTSHITDMSRVFSRRGEDFNQDIGNWDVSNVTDMEGMFLRAESFNQDISNWNVSNVTNMSMMFEEAKAFNNGCKEGDFSCDLNDWDTSNVTTMKSMFSDAEAFNQDIGNWDTSNVESMTNMFLSSTGLGVSQNSFNQDIGSWDVSNVNYMNSTFGKAENFDQDLSRWCVKKIPHMPSGFNTDSGFEGEKAKEPNWGGENCEQENCEQKNCEQKEENKDKEKEKDKEVDKEEEKEEGKEEGSVSGGGETYTTKLMPDGNQWTSENMRHAPTTGNHSCYDNDSANCDEYGRLYDWNAAMTVCEQLGGGWSLPSDDDWQNLETSLGCNDASDKENRCHGLGRKGNKMGGVLNQLGGYVDSAGKFRSLSSRYGYWWTSTEGAFSRSNDDVNESERAAIMRKTTGNNPEITRWYSFRTMSHSVVCVKKGEGGDKEENKIEEKEVDKEKEEKEENKEKEEKEENKEKEEKEENKEKEEKEENKEECSVNGGGETYTTKLMPDGNEWTSENMRHKPSEGNSWCYDDDSANCEKYGRLYNWDAAMTVCQQLGDGWNLPSDTDWQNLETSLGCNNASDKGNRCDGLGWDTTGNAGKLGGFINSLAGNRGIYGDFSELEEKGYWWSSAEHSHYTNSAWYRLFYSKNSNINRYYDYKKTGYSVVCVRDGDEEKKCENKEEENKEEKITTSSEDGYIKDGIVYCEGVGAGKTMEIEGEKYYVAKDKDDAKNNIDEFGGKYPANRICTSNITDMKFMFLEKENFNQDISNWDVSNVTDMRGMFGHAKSFNQDIGNWDVSNVTNMKGVFIHAKSFNKDISNWNTSNVVEMNNMFGGAKSFNQDISNWDTSNVTDMSSMFTRAEDFNQDIGSWDVSNVTTMNKMFTYAKNFNKDISDWDTSNVVDMEWMFREATSFNQDISSWDTSNVTNMIKIFDNAKAFDQDLSNWCVENIGTRPKHFYLKAGFEGEENKEPNWGKECKNKEEKITTPSEDGYIKDGIVYCEGVGAGKTMEIEGNEYYVAKDKGDVKNNIDEFGGKYPANRICTSNITDMKFMFLEEENFNQDISNWDVSNVTDMSYMFTYAKAFNQDISNWDVSNVTSMYRMFREAESFNKDISNWDVSNVTDMDRMFFRAESF